MSWPRSRRAFPAALARAAAAPPAPCRGECRRRIADCGRSRRSSWRVRMPAAFRRRRSMRRTTGGRSPLGCWSRVRRSSGSGRTSSTAFRRGIGPERGDSRARIDAMEAMLASSAAVPGLAKRSTPPAAFRRRAMRTRRGPSLSALLELLPRLAAHLDARVSRHAARSISRKACWARSTRSAMRTRRRTCCFALDLRIDHLLIDEFQDTSFTQLELLRRLTAGWQQGDGRTLFAVGDPMQSIYRFREAEVRIFVEAQAEREVAGVPVESLVLARNFRSHAGLVAWVNDVFPRVLGRRSDPWRGAVAFAPAIADAPDAPPARRRRSISSRTTEAEADRVVAHVRGARAKAKRRLPCSCAPATHLDRVCRRCARRTLRYGGRARCARRTPGDSGSGFADACAGPARRSLCVACGAARAVVRTCAARPGRGRRSRRRAAVANRSRRCWRRPEGSRRVVGRRAGSDFATLAQCLWPAHWRARAGSACDTRARRVACARRRRNARRGDRHRRGRALFRAARRTRRRGRHPRLAGVRRGARRAARRSRPPIRRLACR